jgi:DNA-binding XRE family transcriptional regulator
MWVASELGRLIAATSAVETVFQPLCGPHLRECCRQGGIHHPTALARCLGTSKVTTWYWWNEHAAPSLPMTLRICEVLGVHLADVFLGPHLLPPAETEYSVQLELHLSARAKARRIQWSAVRMRLQRELRRPIAKARSLLAVGRDLGIDSRTLREREPVLCRRIGRRFVRSVHLAAQAKHAVLKRRIAEACVKLQRQRHPITHARIAAVIGQPGLFCRPDARRALAEVLKLDYADWPQAVTVPGRLRSR